ncbi:flippase-like domain-containing protein [Haoranjiania flava]|uniref:Flippase-like domain-containing protein n=1 Tax=Haoranjiania flava TaxID=1856322 RepID=A0AAE3IM17_9BACT|nr:flippase-like domain-containing protein [Haoranjiania flava]MCU7693501.1 flippase-like domain-containing protein [Haoranjiania flava]
MQKNFLKKQYKIWINYVVGPLLFVILSFSIFNKIKQQENLPETWKIIKNSIADQWLLLLLMVLLMIVNWTLEARKWQVLIRPVQQVSIYTGFKAVLSGLSFGLFIPNGMGEYLGRMLYLNQGNRLKSIAVSIMGSLSQLLITLVTGLAALVYFINHDVLVIASTGLSDFWFRALMYVLILATLFFFFLYFKIGWVTSLFSYIPFVKRHRVFIQALTEFDYKTLFKVLFLSLLRYAVFIVQYILMFEIFKVEMPLMNAVAGICVMFLLIAIVPTIPIAELGVRGEVSLRIFGMLSKNAIGIISTTVFIWLINLIIPAIIGSLFVLTVRIFKKNGI